jgi:sec-independent protein translocase protein TatA
MFTGMLQPSHLFLILIIALVFLGPKRIPGARRALDGVLSEFKRAIQGVEDVSTDRASATVVEDEKPRPR